MTIYILCNNHSLLEKTDILLEKNFYYYILCYNLKRKVYKYVEKNNYDRYSTKIKHFC